jgi:small subunit ribosomal protein S20
MANIASQIKRNRQNEKARLRNQSARSEMKTSARRSLELAESGDAEAARSALKDAQRSIDRAVSSGVLHKNTAARRKSRLTARVESLLG